MFNQIPAASRAASIPVAYSMGSPANTEGATMLALMVSDTCEPTRKAPANSKMAASTRACLKVMATDPTEVPKALATSLAPMFQAM